MAEMSLRLNLPIADSDIMKSIEASPQRMMSLLRMYMATKAVEYRAYMQSSRKWTDRTGAAKATLMAEVSIPSSTSVRITLSHGVSYGVWLELANEKRYAVVSPTIRLKAADLVSGLQGIVERAYAGGGL